MQLSSTIFKAIFLKMVSINAEFLVVSMVDTAPESPTTLVTLLKDLIQIDLRIHSKNTIKVSVMSLTIDTISVEFW